MTREAARLEELHAFVRRATALLLGPGEGPESPPALVALAGDGSHRKIYRVQCPGLRTVAIANPLPADRRHPDENEAFLAVREYLHRRDIRVPRFYAADLERGFLLLEDLGDEHLADRVLAAGGWQEDLETLYEQALAILIRMQAPRVPAYESGWTSNPDYTREFVIAHEAAYFHRELVCGAAKIPSSFAEIEAECRRLAELALSLDASAGAAGRAAGRAAGGAAGGTVRSDGPGGCSEESARVFMHRDFQSRNLMLLGDELAVIDFQGGRRGPPGYDLAALLCDPYVCLPAKVRAHLAARYYEQAAAAGVPLVAGMRPESWQLHWRANAANRLMQALGALAKLGIREGRAGFREHIPAGLALLTEILETLAVTPNLRRLIGRLRDRSWEQP